MRAFWLRVVMRIEWYGIYGVGRLAWAMWHGTFGMEHGVWHSVWRGLGDTSLVEQ